MDIADASRAVVELYRYSDMHQGECHAVNVASEDTRVLRDFVEEIHSLCGGSGNLEYGSFVQAKEGALSICPVNENMKKLTGGTWKEQVSFAGGNPEDAAITIIENGGNSRQYVTSRLGEPHDLQEIYNCGRIRL